MGGGPPDFHQGFSCLDVLRIPLALFQFRIRGFHSLWLVFPEPFFYLPSHLVRSITPKDKSLGLGSFPFARRYLGNRCFFLFLWVLRCFSSPRSLPYVMDWRMDDRGLLCRVSPFRNLRVKWIFAPNRSLSQLITSFIGSQCQGIHPVLLLA